jgi:hypothetical protein
MEGDAAQADDDGEGGVPMPGSLADGEAADGEAANGEADEDGAAVSPRP